jgi:small subunit ribosomal protein S8
MSNDRLSDMLSSIKNAAMAGKPFIEVLFTKECESVAKNLEKAGFLSGVKSFKPEGKPFKMLRLDLAYENGIAKISDVKRVSKPGRRVYKGYQELRPMAGGFGVRVVSTSRGVMSSIEAKKKKLGGEVICEVL